MTRGFLLTLQGGSNQDLVSLQFLGWQRRIRLAATANLTSSMGGGVGLRAEGLGSRVEGAGFGVWGLGFEFRVWGSDAMVWGLRGQCQGRDFW
jgi:hypothetical protein